MLKRLIFDYGGTLDTNGLHWAHVLWKGFQYAKIPVSELQFRDAYVYGERSLAAHPLILPSDNFYDLLLKKLHEELSYLTEQSCLMDSHSVIQSWEQTVADYCYTYVKNNMTLTQQVLEAVYKQYKPVLVTNFYGNIHTVLEDFGILSYFQNVIESAVCGVRKPDPAIFRLGVNATDVAAEEVCVVGDSLSKDIVPAKSIGCKTIWLKGKGWADKVEDVTESNSPTTIINNIAQIPEILNLVS